VLRLTLEYDGAGFHGWARQPGLRTVEGVLRDALGSVYREVADLAVAGRTDTGVHASAQVASARVAGGPPAARAAQALNALLPEDVAVREAAEAPEGFHARFSARGRVYEYRVLPAPTRSPLRAGRVLQVPGTLDRKALAACAAVVPGEHDFRAFTPAETRHEVFVRVVEEAAWSERGDELVFRIAADSFLRHMVRTLVGSMLDVARGTRDLGWFRELLAGRERAEAGRTSPAHALCLVEVRF
jgi:tRNA pseudouridine38-40 synthase